jgi:hypothetical protein
MGQPTGPPEILRCHHVWIVEGPPMTTWRHEPIHFFGLAHCAPYRLHGPVACFIAWPL